MTRKDTSSGREADACASPRICAAAALWLGALRCAIAAAFCGLAVWPTPAAAQEPQDLTAATLEELIATPAEMVTGASRYLYKLSDAPASVTIITSEEIRLYGYRTLADVLRSVRGISISYDRNYSYLGLRGLSRPGDLNTRVLILLDGHRLNDNVFDSALIGTEFPVDVDLIERVEVIRGPGVALYGTSAFAAVISVITRNGEAVRGVGASASAGTLGARSARVTFGSRLAGGFDGLFSASRARAEGQTRLFFPEFAAMNNGIAEDADRDQSDKLLATGSFGQFKVQAAYSTRLKHVPTASFGTLFNDSRTRTVDDRGFVDLQYARPIGRRSDLVARAYWDRYHYDGWYVFGDDDSDANEGPSVVNRDSALGVWWGGEAALAHRVSTRDRLTVSGEYRTNRRQDQKNVDEAPASAIYLDDRQHSAVGAFSVQNEWRIMRQLLLNTALRYEGMPSGGGTFTPRLGVILSPRAATTVKVMLSHALRPPSVYERFYESPPNYVSNPELSTEQLDTYEIVAEHDITPLMHFTASVFANRFRDLIVPEGREDEFVQFANGLDVDARGVEVGWNSRSRGGILMRASYAYLLGTGAASTTWTSGAPQHLGKVNFAVPIESLRMTAALSSEFIGTRRTHIDGTLDPVAVANLTLTRTLSRTVEVQGSLSNLFDARYSDPASPDHVQGGIPQDGRQAAIRIVWRAR